MDAAISDLMSRAQEMQEQIAALSIGVRQQQQQQQAGGGTFSLPVNSAAGPYLGGPKFPALKTLDLSQGLANGRFGLSAVGSGQRNGQFSPELESLISKHASLNNLDPSLIREVIRQESSGNPNDRSHAGAMGLMQLMPATAKGFGVTDPFDPEQNVAAGSKLLAGLLREFKGDTALALAAYNAGSGAVKKAGGIPPFPETRNYVAKIMGKLGP